MTANAVLWTNAANCRDCNRCVRVCPVKAVEKRADQARVVAERCLLCGQCVKECPQGAKVYRDGVQAAKALISSGSTVIASVAPSYAAAFSSSEIRGLPSVLRQMGFSLVTETAVGAELIARQSRSIVQGSSVGKHICTPCPAVVSYVMRYEPRACQYLMPIVSPMAAHARLLKHEYGQGCSVVFIGPCIAKKHEADQGTDVDAAITFDELRQWIADSRLNLLASEESDFDGTLPGMARVLPMPGGLAQAAGLLDEGLKPSLIAASGSDEVMSSIDYLLEAEGPLVVEALMCPGGCLGGPGMTRSDVSIHRSRAMLLERARSPQARCGRPQLASDRVLDLSAEYRPEPIDAASPDESRIREVLARIGKVSESDELDCGACGYDTCREKALAVIRGMADLEVCLPFMRRQAEVRTDAIVDKSPNAIAILDERLCIIHANPQFRTMFMMGDAGRGWAVDRLIDAEPCKEVLEGRLDLFNEVVHNSTYGLTYQQIVYRLSSHEPAPIAVVLVNLTQSKRQESELASLRQEALARAEEAMDRQVEMAQEVAQLMARSASETRIILHRLVEMVRGKESS